MTTTTKPAGATALDDVCCKHAAGRPVLTDEHLRAIHRALKSASWEEERFFRERREVMRGLDAYFGADVAHLKASAR